MRLVIDMQGAQTESQFRGIGRYSLELSLAIARNRDNHHEIFLALNGLFPETIEPIRAAFDGIIPQENIRVWLAPGPVRENDPANQKRREIAERIREAFLESLQADAILVTSLFEGFGDDAVTSIGVLEGGSTPVAVILYDLIPLINPDVHFRNSSIHQVYYARKIDSIKRSSKLLAISESGRQEALQVLQFSTQRVMNISGACDASFRALGLTESDKTAVCRKFGIKKPFVMYTGGADERKNLHRLIEAFAGLPETVRAAHQLVLAGKMPALHVEDLLHTAKKERLADDAIVVTGYIDDIDLVALYNSCALFVFPSLHEGFGLPPLEAMACGAPVIAANATSLPEVIGRSDALFDPRSIPAISKKIEAVLTNRAFRDSLVVHGLTQAERFSWEASATRALRALEEMCPSPIARRYQGVKVECTSLFAPRSKRILVVKLDHMGDFILAIPALRKLKTRYPTAHIDAVIGSWNVAAARELGIFDNIYTLDFFKKNSSEAPIAVAATVLATLAQLDEYDMAIDLRRQRDTRFFLVQIRAKMKVGYESFDAEIDRVLDIALPAHVDVPFQSTPMNKTSIAVQILRLVDALPSDVNDFVASPVGLPTHSGQNASVALFPFAGNDVKEWGADKYRQLVEYLCEHSDIDGVNVYLTHESERNKLGLKEHGKLSLHIGLSLLDLEKSLSSNTVCVANNSLGAHLSAYLGLISLGIYGGQETVAEWGPVFPNSYVIHTSAPCSPCHISHRSECPYTMRCLEDIPIDLIHGKVIEAIAFCKHHPMPDADTAISVVSRSLNHDDLEKMLIGSIATLDLSKTTLTEKMALAQCIATSIVPERTKRQLIVDISELVQRDVKTGIQRVTRALLQEIVLNPPEGWQVEPVYATTDEPGYRYARRFMSRFLGTPEDWAENAPLEAWPGDVFLGLDLHHLVVPTQQEFLNVLRRHGVRLYFIVYDLLPVLQPEVFPVGARAGHQRWLETITRFDGVLAISQAVADEMYRWLETFGEARERPYALNWFHLGADVDNSAPTRGLSADVQDGIDKLAQRPTFLMVGTIEPRKGYLQTIAAFDQLWAQGTDMNLVIVGKEGWMRLPDADRSDIPHTVRALRTHAELGKRLFWFEGISDEDLERVYAASTCLIAASHGEGFGLPLIEAARHGLPLLVRDIPVFREVTGDQACFFPDSREPAVIGEAVQAWLSLFQQGQHPSSDTLPHQTWKDSARQVLDAILGNTAPYKTWLPDGVRATEEPNRACMPKSAKDVAAPYAPPASKAC